MNPEFKWGHIHKEEKNPCLLIQEEAEISLGREVTLFTVFQITEDLRWRKLRSIRTPCYSNISLKGPWALKMLTYINIFLFVLPISSMWLIPQ